MNARRVPIDVDTLKPGDYISPDELARAWPNVKQGVRAVTALAWVRGMFAERGIGLCVRTKKGGLSILTMDKAIAHGSKAPRQYVKRALHAHIRNGSLDARMMTDDERRRHDGSLIRNAKLMSGFAKVVDRMVVDEAAGKHVPFTPRLPKVT